MEIGMRSQSRMHTSIQVLAAVQNARITGHQYLMASILTTYSGASVWHQYSFFDIMKAMRTPRFLVV